jgi:SAM-dependent methyltransferase
MFTSLNRHAVAVLRCPLCKGPLQIDADGARCTTCAADYSRRPVDVGSHLEGVYDFRVHRPPWCRPASHRVWADGQREYEAFHEAAAGEDDFDAYRGEIDSVEAIYAGDFALSGAVLDVGGHQGRLRHFLPPSDRERYVSVDPLLEAFQGIERQPNLLRAYPSLAEPCNFVAGRAEALPVASGAFDWVHMRSVIDHFEDPFLALKEACRVLKPGGRLLVGVAILERLQHVDRGTAVARAINKLRTGGLRSLGGAVLRQSAGRVGLRVRNPEDHHIFHFTYDQLLQLVAASGFHTGKVHWQKPPFDYCVYLSATVAKAPEGTLIAAADAARPGPAPMTDGDKGIR